MDSQHKDPQAVTNDKDHKDDNGYYMQNRRTLEFLFIAGFLALALPVSILFGVASGEKTGAIAYPVSQSAAVPTLDYRSVVMGSPGDEDKGHALFQTNCVACHGAVADGQGPAAPALKPPPRNFLDPTTKWTKGRDLPVMYLTISEGSPGTAMTGYANMLTVQERWAIVHYIASLPGVRGQYQPIDEALAATWRPEKAL